MQHVDEGDLHAWLDGALDQLGDGRAAQVREHLRTCAACREALVAEETMRARADQVLALAVPKSIDAPPFETLVARARALQPTVAPAQRSRLSRVTRMGWAASVVIALGAGWMARTLELGSEPADRVASAPVSEVVQPAAPSADPTVAAPSDAVVAAGPRSAEMAGAGPAGPTSAAQPVRQNVATPPVVASGAGQSVQRRAAEEAVAPEKSVVAQLDSALERNAPPAAPAPVPVVKEPAPAPQVATEQRTTATSANLAEPARTTGRTVLVSRRPRAGEIAASSAVPRSSGLGIQGGRDTTSVPGLFAQGGVGSAGASRVEVSTDADIDEAVDLIVPDLPVLRVEWTEVSPGRPGLRVLQRLAPGDTLEVRFVRSGGAAADAAADPLAAVVGVPLRAGWSQVVRVHRDGWLVARAPLKVEELEALVNSAGRRSR